MEVSSIRQFEAFVQANPTVVAFDTAIKEYCRISGKQYEAVMSLIQHSNHDFSVIRLEYKSYKAEITLENKMKGTLLITENSVVRYE